MIKTIIIPLVFTLLIIPGAALSLQESCLPVGGIDSSNGNYTLDSEDVEMLRFIDDLYYRSRQRWDKTTSFEGDFIEFDFTINVPDTAAINRVSILFEWKRDRGIQWAKLYIWDASEWIEEELLCRIQT